MVVRDPEERTGGVRPPVVKHGARVLAEQEALIASIDSGAVHVSIAHSQRYPTWDEILAVRAWAFPPETEVVMVLARASEYVNLHNNCFHLWESACGREGR